MENLKKVEKIAASKIFFFQFLHITSFFYFVTSCVDWCHCFRLSL